MTLAEYLKASDMTQQQLADLLGVSDGLVSHWLVGRKQIQAAEVFKIGRMSAWQVRPHDLRPDLWPNASDAIPPATTRNGA